MPRPLALALAPLFIAIFAGCGESPPPPTRSGATQTCPDGYFWNGKECEKQRTIILEQGTSQPPPPPPPTQ